MAATGNPKSRGTFPLKICRRIKALLWRTTDNLSNDENLFDRGNQRIQSPLGRDQQAFTRAKARHIEIGRDFDDLARERETKDV
jgi:hypothetical protein